MKMKHVFLCGMVAGIGIQPAGLVLRNLIQSILELYGTLMREMIPDFLSLGTKTAAPEPIVWMSWGLVGWLILMLFALSFVWTVRKLRGE